MTAFMTLVERAVRPVAAGPRRKLRMREELLAHLEGVYADELARGADSAAAAAEAVRRFGDPAALTAELQQSVSFRDRLDARLHHLFGWHPGRSTASYAVRTAGLMAALVVAWFALALVATQLRRPADPTVPSASQLVWLFGSLLAFAPPAVFVLTALAVRVRASLFGAFGAARSWRRVVALAVVSGLVVPAAGAGFYLAGVPDAAEILFALTPLSVGGAVVGYLLVPMLIIWLALKSGPTAIRQAEWAALDIGG
jgi:hypothetical protein